MQILTRTLLACLLGGWALAPDANALEVSRARSHIGDFSGRCLVDPTTPQITTLTLETTEPQRFLFRAIGRGLPGPLPSANLPTPVLSLNEGTRLLATDRGSAGAPAMTALARLAGAFPIDPTGLPAGFTAGAALAPSLGRGTFTLATTSGDAGAGAVFFEAHAVAGANPPARVRHFSVRGHTGPGGAVLVVGFIIRGDAPLRLLVRGLGPALANVGVPRPVADPLLEIYAAGAPAPLVVNDNWSDNPEIAETARRLQAVPLAPGSRDAALLVALAPGAYTALLAITDQSSGDGTIEFHVLD